MNITNQEMMIDLYNITLENAFDIFEPKDFDHWYSSYKDYNKNPPISGDHIRIFALIKETNQSILIFE